MRVDEFDLKRTEIFHFFEFHSEIEIRKERGWFSEKIYRAAKESVLLRNGLTRKRLRHAIGQGWVQSERVGKGGGHETYLMSLINPLPSRSTRLQCFKHRFWEVFDSTLGRVYHAFARRLR